MKKIYGLFCGVLLLGACASDADKMNGMSAEELYNLAYENLGATKYAKAAEVFEKVETDHPYSKWAVKSKLMGAFAYYKEEKYDDAVIAIDRYLKYHPGNKDVPYALYLKGMCYYDQISSADKDQGDTAKAADAFGRLIALFPDSEYAKDAQNKMSLTEDYKAGQEMIIGRYYLNEGNYLSALNRFNVVLEEYQTTIQIEEAVYRQVEIYAILGLNNYAAGYYKILRNNYPEGKWTAKAAKIMDKIGMTDKVAPLTTMAANDADSAKEEVADKTESKGWFSGWFGGDDAEDKTDEVKAEVEETVVEVQEQVAEDLKPEDKVESKGWFSGWFSSNDAEDKADEVKAEVEETVVEVQEQVAEDLKSRDKVESKGWFSSNDAEDKADEVKTEVDETVVEVQEQVAEDLKPEDKVESKGWFSGWFSSNDAEKKEPEVKDNAESEESWFGRKWNGLFGSEQELKDAKQEADATINNALDNVDESGE
ncbi:MAG: outer membrane protein assembly factor BamD [Alphaproteobacteria bacterium]|nr:outer membrane protein assembly factor BamD [Alphaproteobacteria bacterium]